MSRVYNCIGTRPKWDFFVFCRISFGSIQHGRVPTWPKRDFFILALISRYEKERNMIILRKMNFEDAVEQWEYVTRLPANENGLTNQYEGISFDEYKESVLPVLMMHENPVNMPDWFVPETFYYLWDDDKLVGEFRIRHYLTDALKTGAGHIGYSIKKECRCKGYGTKGLALTLDVARKIIPEDEIYLRVLKNNVPSLKAICKNGAYIASEDDTHYFMRIKK